MADKVRIMNYKVVLLASVVGAMFSASAQHAFANDGVDPSQCTVHGIVSGGGTIDSEKYTSVGLTTKSATYPVFGGFGEGALAYTCNNWNFQADASLYYFGASGSDKIAVPTIDANANSRQGHIGGAIFLREPDQGAIGISGSWVFESGEYPSLLILNPVATTNMGVGRIGAFGEIYAGDAFTFGLSAHYFNGNINFQTVGIPGITTDINGLEASAFAKFYPTDQLALTTQVDFTRDRWTPSFGNYYDISGVAITLGVEYLVSDSNFSLFANGIYAARRQQQNTSANFTDTADLQALVGFKYAFGGNSTSTIVGRDRGGTYDNTSTFLEKLPDLFSIGTVGDVASDTL